MVIAKPTEHFFIGSSSDQQPLAVCGLPEVRFITRKVPRHSLASGDKTICRHRGDEGQDGTRIHSINRGFALAEQAHAVLDLSFERCSDQTFGGFMDRLATEREGVVVHGHH